MNYKKWLFVFSAFVLTFCTGVLIRRFVIIKYFAPDIKFESRSHDFGEIERDIPVSTWFKFENIGIMPLQIKNVISSCDCTTFQFPQNKINCGGKDSIFVRFDASKKDNFYQQIYIYSNATEIPIALYIVGACVDKE